MKEEWKKVKGFNGVYEISNYGNLRSYIKKNGRGLTSIPRILKKNKDKYGYIVYGLSLFNVNGLRKVKYIKAHRLVAKEFIDENIDNKTINHLDFNKENNFVGNLEICTARENTLHCVKNKKHQYGEKIHTAKITKEIARLIRNDCNKIKGYGSLVKIAKKYNVSTSIVSNIRKFKTWKIL